MSGEAQKPAGLLALGKTVLGIALKILEPAFCTMDRHLQARPYVMKVANMTHQRPAHVLCVFLGCLSGLILYIWGENAYVHAVGFIYPLYASFKALRTPDFKDDTMWLTYWVVFGWFILIESFTDVFIGWIPFYYWLKFLFLFWCFLPQTQGAKQIYVMFLDRLADYDMNLLAFTADAVTGKKPWSKDHPKRPWQGVVRVEIFEGKEIKNVQKVGKQDPYVRAVYGEQKHDTQVSTDTVDVAHFTNEFCHFVLEPDTPHIEFQLRNKNAVKDDFIGSCKVELASLPVGESWLKVFDKNGVYTGSIRVAFAFNRPICVKVVAAADLRVTQKFGDQDPFAKLTMKGPVYPQKGKLRTATHKDGHQQALWGTNFFFNLKPGAEPSRNDHLLIEVFHEGSVKGDSLLGSVKIGILELLAVRDTGKHMEEECKEEEGTTPQSSFVHWLRLSPEGRIKVEVL